MPRSAFVACATLAAILALTLRDARATSPQAGVFVVTSVEDTEDVQWGDGACGDTLGRCTLRGALQEANAHEGADTIRFQIGTGRVGGIKPKSPLPVVFDETTIDATTQPYYAGIPLIWLDGAEAGIGADGIVLAGDTSVVKGLAITGFDGIGVVVTDNSDSRIEANYVGVGLDGRTAAGNRGHGVHLLRARNTVIGGTNVSLRNVISGNGGNGVHVEEVGSRGNRVVGNFIGVNADGNAAVPNGVDGVSIENAPENFVGGGAAGAVNLIAGNLDDGVEIVGPGAVSNTVQANWIGTGVDGVTAIGHNDAGVMIAGATDNLVIGNVLAGSGGFGLELGPQTRGNRVVANYVGTNPTGDSDLGNGAGGIGIRDGASNTVGDVGLPNRVGGNRGPGILIAGSRAGNNRVEGNEIGRLGETVMPNGGFGVVIRDGARENQVVSNTAADGLRVWGPGTDANVLEANTVTSAEGPERLGVGIEVGQGSRNTFLDRNTVSKTGRVGILVQGLGTDGTRVQGGSLDGVAGTAIIVHESAGRTTLEGTEQDPITIRDAVQAGVELRGNGHLLHYVDVARSPVAVELYGSRHSIDGLMADEIRGPAIAVREGSGHWVNQLAVGEDRGLPIDLGADGPDINDHMDTDAGPNGHQNYPTVRQAWVERGGFSGEFELAVDVELDGKPSARFNVMIYSVASCDRNGVAQGRMASNRFWEITTGADGFGRAVVHVLGFPADASGVAATAGEVDELSTSEVGPCTPLTRGRLYLPVARTD